MSSLYYICINENDLQQSKSKRDLYHHHPIFSEQTLEPPFPALRLLPAVAYYLFKNGMEQPSKVSVTDAEQAIHQELSKLWAGGSS